MVTVASSGSYPRAVTRTRTSPGGSRCTSGDARGSTYGVPAKRSSAPGTTAPVLASTSRATSVPVGLDGSSSGQSAQGPQWVGGPPHMPGRAPQARSGQGSPGSHARCGPTGNARGRCSGGAGRGAWVRAHATKRRQPRSAVRMAG